MSGGRFGYDQYKIAQIADDIEQEIRSHKETPFDVEVLYSKETIAEFKTAVELLRRAQVYAQRIDWLLSDDDGEESFHSRLAEDLAAHTVVSGRLESAPRSG